MLDGDNKYVADQNEAISTSYNDNMQLELDFLSRKEQLKKLRNDPVHMKCMVKRTAQRLSYKRLKEKAMNRLKLLGFAELENASEKDWEKPSPNPTKTSKEKRKEEE